MSDTQANTQEPQVLLGQLLFGKQMTYCLSGMARLGVADHMNATPMTVEEYVENHREAFSHDGPHSIPATVDTL